MIRANRSPVRTCVVCGAKAEQPELIRLALSGGRPVVDAKKRLPGRGAYVCRRQSCIENLAGLKPGAWPFRKPVDQDGWRALSAGLLSGLESNSQGDSGIF